MIDKHIASNIEQHKAYALFKTDLIAAFNLLDHKDLLEKLRIYGFTCETLKLMETFLSNHIYYIVIQGFKSPT